MNTRSAFLCALLAVAAITAAPVAPAQSENEGAPAASPAAPGAPDASAPAASYTDAELKSFGEAAADVQRVRVIYALKLHTIDNADQRAELMEAAVTSMKSMVEKHGLTAMRFHEILRAAQQQPNLAERINRTLE